VKQDIGALIWKFMGVERAMKKKLAEGLAEGLTAMGAMFAKKDKARKEEIKKLSEENGQLEWALMQAEAKMKALRKENEKLEGYVSAQTKEGREAWSDCSRVQENYITELQNRRALEKELKRRRMEMREQTAALRAEMLCGYTAARNIRVVIEDKWRREKQVWECLVGCWNGVVRHGPCAPMCNECSEVMDYDLKLLRWRAVYRIEELEKKMGTAIEHRYLSNRPYHFLTLAECEDYKAEYGRGDQHLCVGVKAVNNSEKKPM
jgi:DNA repair exonuclease SbcCD ATPase subunit